ncbi:MAG: lysophospholipid acyltransferase family protein [Burkholderiales bacterium]
MTGVVLRSLAYALLQLVVTPLYSIVALLTFPFAALTRYRIISSWSRLMVWAAEYICGVRYRVLGKENVPSEPCIVMAKHESAWETLAFQVVLPPQVWVIKRELLWVPFFGWGLAMLSPIAIDRTDARRALRQMIEQGRARLAHGFSIVVFPEGTRSAPGERGTYHAGGAWLAIQTGALILPVAHNAGDHWPRNSFLKYPGVVTISMGPPVRATREMKALDVTRRVEQWIEDEMQRIRPR